MIQLFYLKLYFVLPCVLSTLYVCIRGEEQNEPLFMCTCTVSFFPRLPVSTEPLFVCCVAFIRSDRRCDRLTCLPLFPCSAGRVRVLPPVAPAPDERHPLPTADGKIQQRRAEGKDTVFVSGDVNANEGVVLTLRLFLPLLRTSC